MDRPIDRIQAKVDRAKQHVEDLHLALREWGATEPYSARFKDDLKGKRRHYWVDRQDPVPLNVEAIAADALGNLREAVDHIAYQLERAAHGAPPKHLVYFPVGETAAKYKANRLAYIKCSGQAVIDAFDAAEPYKGGKGAAIWRLNALKKSDKHELLIATASIMPWTDGAVYHRQAMMQPDFPDWARDVPIPSFYLRSNRPVEPVKMGDYLGSEPLHAVMHDEGKFVGYIAFNRPDVMELEPALKTLQDFTNLVDGLVAAFAPLLP